MLDLIFLKCLFDMLLDGLLDVFLQHNVSRNSGPWPTNWTVSRLTLEGYSQHIKLFSRYNDIDVALDTFPYSGGLTTCEALWMGVPVITLPDETFASRHTLSHLTNLGLSDMVAQNSCDYIDIAVKLANDVNRLRKIRFGLRLKMSQSPLCDGETFATDFNYAMWQIWKEWCQAQNSKHVINKS
jgi:protein O-GlcNAc transferase